MSADARALAERLHHDFMTTGARFVRRAEGEGCGGLAILNASISVQTALLAQLLASAVHTGVIDAGGFEPIVTALRAAFHRRLLEGAN